MYSIPNKQQSFKDERYGNVSGAYMYANTPLFDTFFGGSDMFGMNLRQKGSKWYKRFTWRKQGTRYCYDFALQTEEKMVAVERASRLARLLEYDIRSAYENGGSKQVQTIAMSIDWYRKTLADKQYDYYQVGDALHDYEQYLMSNMLKSDVIMGYMLILRQFAEMVGYHLQVQQINLQHFTQFKNWCKERRLSLHTVNTKIRAIKTFLNWLKDSGRIQEIPNVKRIPTAQSKPRFFTNAEFYSILRNVLKIRASNKVELSDYEIDLYKRAYHFYRDTGLRLMEPFIYELQGNKLVIVGSSTKNAYQRNVYLNEDQSMLVIELRDFMKKHVDKKGCAIGTVIKNLSRIFQTAVKAAEIPYGKFHNLRDTFATRLYYASGSIAKVCDRLGHSDIKMTRKYTHFDEIELEEAFPDLAELKRESAEYGNRSRKAHGKLAGGKTWGEVLQVGNLGYIVKS